MADPHATVDDLLGTEDTDGFLSQAAAASFADPDDALRQLRRASAKVDLAVRQPYDVDVDGAATDPDVAAALRDAVCAQVEQWVEVGEENSIDGLAGTARATGGGVRAPDLAPRALEILLLAGLVQPANSVRVVSV